LCRGVCVCVCVHVCVCVCVYSRTCTHTHVYVLSARVLGVSACLLTRPCRARACERRSISGARMCCSALRPSVSLLLTAPKVVLHVRVRVRVHVRVHVHVCLLVHARLHVHACASVCAHCLF
jgi:hypothetical protein